MAQSGPSCVTLNDYWIVSPMFVLHLMHLSLVYYVLYVVSTLTSHGETNGDVFANTLPILLPGIGHVPSGSKSNSQSKVQSVIGVIVKISAKLII